MANGTPIPVRAADLPRKQFQVAARETLDRQAGAIGQIIEALNQAHEKLRMLSEFAADLSVRLDKLEAAHRAD